MQEPSLKKSVPIVYNIFLNFGSDVDIRFSCMKWEFCRLPLLTNGKYIEYPTHNTVKCQSEFFRCCASIVDPIFSRTIQEKMKVVILTTLGVELIIHFFNRLNMTQKAKFHVYWGGGGGKGNTRSPSMAVGFNDPHPHPLCQFCMWSQSSFNIKF